MFNEHDFARLSPAQRMVNQACMEDALSIQTQCLAMVGQLKGMVHDNAAIQPDPIARMTQILGILAQKKAAMKTLQDRLYFWGRQDHLVDSTHSTLDCVVRTVAKVDTLLTDAVDEFTLLATLSKAFLGVADAVGALATEGHLVPTVDIRQNAPSTNTMH